MSGEPQRGGMKNSSGAGIRTHAGGGGGMNTVCAAGVGVTR